MKNKPCLAKCAVVAASIVASASSLAAEPARLDAWRALLPVHAGWTLLAGFGLLAVAAAAWTVKRPRRSETSGEAAPADPGPSDGPAQREEAETPAPPIVAVAECATEREPMPATVIVEAIVPSEAPKLVEAPAPTERPAAPAEGSQLFLALHHIDLSINVLHQHLLRDPRPMPAVWLMLLDLCRTHGREQAFGTIALEFHARFNVCKPDWQAYPPDRDDPGLESYPRLVQEITQTWGTHECRRLLERLLYDNRGGNRRGFTLNAYNDLIALRRAADAVLETIEADLAEEAKVRSAYASAAVELLDAAAETRQPASPYVQDLEAELRDDLAAHPQSAIEREHPAFARMLAREWGNAGMSARLCEMLARGGDGTHPLSKEAAEEVALLRKLAERLHVANGIDFPGEAAA